MSGVVSWAGPVEQAAQGLRAATELLESKRPREGIEKLIEVQRHIDEAIGFISRKDAA